MLEVNIGERSSVVPGWMSTDRVIHDLFFSMITALIASATRDWPSIEKAIAEVFNSEVPLSPVWIISGRLFEVQA